PLHPGHRVDVVGLPLGLVVGDPDRVGRVLVLGAVADPPVRAGQVHLPAEADVGVRVDAGDRRGQLLPVGPGAGGVDGVFGIVRPQRDGGDEVVPARVEAGRQDVGVG